MHPWGHSTASDDWHRESERNGLAWDRAEKQARYYDLPLAPPAKSNPNPIPPQPYEKFWEETTKDRLTWWDKWKDEFFKRHNL